MRSTSAQITAALIAIVMGPPAIGCAHAQSGAWLDTPKPAAWNRPGQPIPSAPASPDEVDPRCRTLARPPQLPEDRQLRDRGWDLVGAYQGGWQVVVILGTAAYDGMCRPNQYQGFVFVRGVFAGTLSPQPVDSRTDGALSDVILQDGNRLTVSYARYADADPLCCPSRTTSVIFEIDSDTPVVRPISISTNNNITPPEPAAVSGPVLAGTSWRLVRFEGGDGTVLKPDDPSKYTIELASGGQLSARIDCNRGRGTWTSAGPSQITFGPLALTRAQCAPGSMHDQIVKQWGYVRSYVLRDGHLFLSLMADGGIYEFEPDTSGK